MKFSGKPILVFLMMFILAAQVFAIEIEDLKKNVNNFAISLPFHSTIGLNWSDAYIGGFRHFGVGPSIGLTTMNYKLTNKLTDSFSMPKAKDTPLVGKNYFSLPADSLEARIGVPVIPIDVGVKIGYLNQDWLKSRLGIGLNNLLLGADVRYVIVNSKVLPMRLSAGFGINYMNGGMSYSPSKLNFSGIEVNNPNVGITWNTFSLELKAQASFPYKIITPYAGAGLSYAWSKAGYEVSYSEKSEALEEKFKFSGNGFKVTQNYKGPNTRIFAGFSVNVVLVRLDMTAMYEIFNNNLGVTLGLRYQM